jgi:hypothetical protein
MRGLVGVLTIVALLPACNGFGSKAQLKDVPAGPTPSQRTSIIGDWVLKSNPDSTTFVGAERVELSLQPSSFVLTARYTGQTPVVVSGTAQIIDENGGLLRLIPQSVSQTISNGAIGMVVGQPVELVATASEGSMVFAQRGGLMLPSSVWSRKDAAFRAGVVSSEAAGEVEKAKKKTP